MINKVILVGNLGADPEIRTLENGVKVGRLNVATTERTYNRDTQEAKEHTEWHRVVVWRQMADFADRFIRKGSQVYVEGKIRTNEWTDQNGVKRYTAEIIADNLRLLGRKSDNPSAGTPMDGSNYGSQQRPTPAPGPGSSPSTDPIPVTSADDIDDLPF